MYDFLPQRFEAVKAAISAVNYDGQGRAVELGKYAERKGDDYAPVFLYLAPHDAEEGDKPGRLGLYYHLEDAQGEDLGTMGGAISQLLNDDCRPIPARRLNRAVCELLDDATATLR